MKFYEIKNFEFLLHFKCKRIESNVVNEINV